MNGWGGRLGFAASRTGEIGLLLCVAVFTATACGRCDQVEKALNLFTEMKQMNLTPTHVTFNAMIHATGRSFRHYDRAFNLFEEMLAAGYAHDVYSLNGVLLACRYRSV